MNFLNVQPDIVLSKSSPKWQNGKLTENNFFVDKRISVCSINFFAIVRNTLCSICTYMDVRRHFRLQWRSNMFNLHAKQQEFAGDNCASFYLVDIIGSRHNWAFEYTVITVYSVKMSHFMRVYRTTRNYYGVSLSCTVLQCLWKKKRINAYTISHPHLSNWITIIYPGRSC